MKTRIEKIKWSELADAGQISRTIESLKKNGIDAEYFNTRNEARKRIFELIPFNSEVFTMTSVTLDSLGISSEINESGKYDSVIKKLSGLDRKTHHKEMRKMGSAPDYTIGSVHAVTEDGKLIIASNTGSQLSAYVYGAGKVIFVIGTQKIVSDLEEGLKRIYEYTLPLESERARKAYGVSGSNVSKLLIINKEINPERIKLIFVNEELGF